MELHSLFMTCGISLGLGLLVGLQRQRAESDLAGIRTFPLITLLGTVCGLLSQTHGGWIVAAGFFGLALLILSANRAKVESGIADPGMTTEVAILLMYGIGAYLVLGRASIAVAVTGAVVILLHFKQPLHRFVQKIGEKDVLAVMQLALISLVILPVLPNEAYGPFKVLNPFKTWLMVVLIVSISLAGYVAYKLFGQNTGTLLAGLLGGAVSSTATTVSFARRARATPDIATVAAVVITIAAAVSFARVIIEVAIVAPHTLSIIGPPLAVELIWLALLAAVLWLLAHKGDVQLQEPENPAELKSALIFGLLYAIIIFMVAATEHYLGDRGLYVAAVVSGLTDMDAITLSTAQLVNAQRLTPNLGWRLILVAAMSNTLFKGILVVAMGHPRLAWRVGLLFGAAIAGGAVLLLAWPDEAVGRWLRDLIPATQPATQATTNP
jgi:uncharacterized membrane protein (DUF4010 family)